MPRLAVLAAAAQVHRRVHDALFEQRQAQRAEVRRRVHVEAAVPVHQRGVVAVELQPLAVHDEHRDARAVLAGEEHLLRVVVGGLEVGDIGRAEERRLFRGDVVPVDRRRARERRERVEDERIVVVAAEPAGDAHAGQFDLVLDRAVQRVRVDARRHVLEIRHEEPAAGRAGGFDGFWLFRHHVAPFRGAARARIEPRDLPVRRAGVGLDEKRIAHVADDLVGVVADLGDDGLPRLVGGIQVAVVHRVAILALAALGDVQDREPFVFGRGHGVEALRVAHVLERELVGRLRRADAVVVHLVVIVRRRQLLAPGRLAVAAVEEPVVLPGDVGDLDPFQFVGQRLPARDVHDVAVVPVRSAGGLAVGGISGGFRQRQGGELRGALGREGIRVEQDLGRRVEPLLHVDDGLILQAVIFREEEIVAAAVGRTEAGVVVQLREAFLEASPERDRVEVAERDLVFGLDPSGRVR